MKYFKLNSDFEWQIMKSLWKQSPASVREVWMDISPDGTKAYTTVQTYMDRLAKKGILTREKIGMVNFYSPDISEQDALDQAMENFASRAFDGSFGLLASYLIDSKHLKKSDFAEIRRLLNKLEENSDD